MEGSSWTMQIQRGMATVFVFSALLGLGCTVEQSDGDRIGAAHAMLSNGRVGNLSVVLTTQSDWQTGYCTNVTL